MTSQLPTADTLLTEMLRLSKLLDKGIAELVRLGQEYAEAEDAYRKAKAVAYMQAPAEHQSTVRAREAYVDDTCGAERKRALLAEGMRMAAMEAVRSRRAQMSALQTVANALKAEAELGR